MLFEYVPVHPLVYALANFRLHPCIRPKIGLPTNFLQLVLRPLS